MFMKYNIKSDNYKTFSVFKENVMKPRAYFIPFGDIDLLRNADIRTKRYSSDRVSVLSGEWDFVYYPKVSKVPSVFNTDKINFDKVTVPSCWQFTGYEPPVYINVSYQFEITKLPEIPEDCSVGVYRKKFGIKDTDKNYTVSFLGVAGSLDVYVNGEYVGYSEGSHNTSEFELNGILNEGENELVAVVHKYCNGSYLECQDMFRNNGIFRDVLLFETENNSIYDYEVKTDYNGKYSLTLLPSLKLTDECTLTVSIEELGLSKSVNVSPSGIEAVSFSDLDVEEWSAEIPKLYTLIITLSKGGKLIEAVCQKVGFRRIKINGNVFTFNGKGIKLLGVNHHDTDAKKGYALNVEDMERDIKICKDYNVNCIRTSHYPPDPMFIELCDEYGIYVVDEADIETHGCGAALHRMNALSHNSAWKEHYWDRVYRMFERDKNHPSITMWSLGNEAGGFKNQDYCYENLKKLSDIPVHYEGVVRTGRFAYDVISQMYPWQSKMKKVADGRGLGARWYSKPYYLCEYCHAMGVGAGELETYVRDFFRADNMMGGCIWEFADHAVYHEDGKYKYTYGGDHGEIKHDGNFCVDGLFFPDRTPHAGALQMKNCYRPVRAEKQGGDIAFTNLNYFKPVNYTVKWNSESKSGSFELELQPRETKRVSFEPFGYMVFRYYEGQTEIASEQIIIEYPECPEYKAKRKTDTDIAVYKDSIVIDFEGLKLILGASIYRAPLDNDRYLSKAWDALSLGAEQLKILNKTEKNGKIYVDAVIAGKKIKNLVALQFVIGKNSDGSVDVKLRCTDSKPIPFAPRFGITAQLDGKYENVKYFGMGDKVNLPDFMEHAMLGEYEMKVDEMREKYIMPQESSMRCGVSYAELTDGNSDGIVIQCEKKPFIFSADRFTSQQCAVAKHQEELKLQNFTYLHIDSYQLGAASGICGPPPTRKYRKNSLKGESVSIKIRRKQ